MQIKVFTAFSGYDSHCLSLNRLSETFLDFSYELVGWSEIDKHACKAHDALFPQWKGRNFGDISKIDFNKVPDFDLFTYSSPCQDFSTAGKRRGGENGSGTRSSLLWECERAIKSKRPKFCILENVAALMNKKNIKLFNDWKYTIEELGYANYSQILNAKDYGVPQNRKRVFLVSVRNDVNLRYFFPEPFKLKKRMTDVLENEVHERYYVNLERFEGLIKSTGKEKTKGNGFAFKPKGLFDDIANSLTTKCGGGRKTDNFIITLHDSEKHDAGIIIYETGKKYRIRKLTERECFRLMGVDDKDIDTIQACRVPKTQQYKMAGNAIVVDVLYHIFRKMFTETQNENRQLTLF